MKIKKNECRIYPADIGVRYIGLDDDQNIRYFLESEDSGIQINAKKRRVRRSVKINAPTNAQLDSRLIRPMNTIFNIDPELAVIAANIQYGDVEGVRNFVRRLLATDDIYTVFEKTVRMNIRPSRLTPQAMVFHIVGLFIKSYILITQKCSPLRESTGKSLQLKSGDLKELVFPILRETFRTISERFELHGLEDAALARLSATISANLKGPALNSIMECGYTSAPTLTLQYFDEFLYGDLPRISLKDDPFQALSASAQKRIRYAPHSVPIIIQPIIGASTNAEDGDQDSGIMERIHSLTKKMVESVEPGASHLVMNPVQQIYSEMAITSDIGRLKTKLLEQDVYRKIYQKLLEKGYMVTEVQKFLIYWVFNNITTPTEIKLLPRSIYTDMAFCTYARFRNRGCPKIAEWVLSENTYVPERRMETEAVWKMVFEALGVDRSDPELDNFVSLILPMLQFGNYGFRYFSHDFLHLGADGLPVSAKQIYEPEKCLSELIRLYRLSSG